MCWLTGITPFAVICRISNELPCMKHDVGNKHSTSGKICNSCDDINPRFISYYLCLVQIEASVILFLDKICSTADLEVALMVFFSNL